MGNVNKLKGSILSLRGEGKSINEIKELLNCSKSVISYHINMNGMGGVHNNFKKGVELNDGEFLETLNQNDILEIVKLKMGGATYDEIFKQFEISYDKIKRVCRIYKVNIGYTKLRFENPEFISQIKKEYEEIKNLKIVAKKFKIGHQKLREYVSVVGKTEVGDEIKKKKAIINVTNHRKKRKLELIDYKGGSCKKCGYCKSSWSLHFHHINPEEKEFTLSSSTYSLEKLKIEADKCILLCSNCHGEIHEEINEFGESEFISNLKHIMCPTSKGW